jgi:hypothetical protein
VAHGWSADGERINGFKPDVRTLRMEGTVSGIEPMGFAVLRDVESGVA